MAGTVTVTAPTGAGVSASALAFTGVRQMTVDPIACSLSVMLANGQVRVFDLKATSTITATASSGTFTFTYTQ